MKKFLLFALVLAGSTQSYSQCTITGCTPSVSLGYCTDPGTGTSVADGEVGVAYSDVIQFSIATTAGGGAITIVAANIVSFTAPDGLTATYNPVSGVILAGQSGCIEITGTPTTEMTGGTIEISVDVITDGTTISQDLAWDIDITASTAGLEQDENSFVLFPNPATDQVNIQVTEPSQIMIYSITGELVVSKLIAQTELVDISFLESGIYYVVNETSNVKQKLMKQ